MSVTDGGPATEQASTRRSPGGVAGGGLGAPTGPRGGGSRGAGQVLATTVVVLALCMAGASWASHRGGAAAGQNLAVAAGADKHPQPAPTDACSVFMHELLGGSPARESQSAPLWRAAQFAADGLSARLRSSPASEAQWSAWQAARVRRVSVQLEQVGVEQVDAADEGGGWGWSGGQDEAANAQSTTASGAAGVYLTYRMRRQPETAGGQALDEQEWQVVCTAGRSGDGWLVTNLEEDPKLGTP